MGHSIAHGATAVPGLSEAAVTYIITGSVDSAIQNLTFEDLCDPDLRTTIN